MSQPLHEEIMAVVGVSPKHGERTMYVVCGTVLVRWAATAQALQAKLDQAACGGMPGLRADGVCPDCGPTVVVDGDGCCATCGCDTVDAQWVEKILEEGS